jgi:apolipoprotein N-acyltransferase
MTVLKNIRLSLLTGLLLALSWPEIGNQAWLVFVAFIPLFFVIENSRNWRAGFLYSFLSFFLWHLLTVWWMWYSTPIGSLSAWLINSMMMAGVISFAKFSDRKLKWVPFEIILSIYWLTFEFIHLYWDLKWPWMNLGHVFANHTNWIQWYAYTGVYGGAFWVFVVNGLTFRFISKWKVFTQKASVNIAASPLLALALLFIIGPISVSMYLKKQKPVYSKSIHVLLVQPNVDTYTEKFDGLTPLQQSEHMMGMLENADTNALVILPETAVPEFFNLDSIIPESIDTLLKFSRENQLKIIGGFSIKDQHHSYNSACLIEEGGITETRNKIKLLTFAEHIPFGYISDYWSHLVHKQGGIANSYGVDDEAQIFSFGKEIKLGTLICFESVFSDIAAEMCRKGAQAFIIITNDDWWGNSPGYRQHFSYARIKAIENRRYVARAANTGMSGVIDAYGTILSSSNYKETQAILSEIKLNATITFFSTFERYIRYSIAIFALIFALVSWLKRFYTRS